MLKHFYLCGMNPRLNYSYKIIDDGFDEKIKLNWIEGIIGAQPVLAVIEMYGRKGLPIAPNIPRVIMIESEMYRISIKEIVVRNRRYNPRWSEFEKEFEKYMVLM